MQSNILSHNQIKFIAKRLRSSMSRRVVVLSNMRNRPASAKRLVKTGHREIIQPLSSASGGDLGLVITTT
jgi:hypothetical protein